MYGAQPHEIDRGSGLLQCFVNSSFYQGREYKMHPKVRNLFEKDNLVNESNSVKQDQMLMKLSAASRFRSRIATVAPSRT